MLVSNLVLRACLISIEFLKKLAKKIRVILETDICKWLIEQYVYFKNEFKTPNLVFLK
jgi:hypothetical protein